MRRKAILLFLLLCPLGSGCGLFGTGARNLWYEANLIKTSRYERLCLDRMAHQAWEEVKGSCPQYANSVDYACGFKEGFVDYLYAGGNGEPPAMPPKRYLRFREQKAHGCEALLAWYAGYRHGAAVAMASGLRQRLLIPLPPPPGPSLPPPLPPLPPTGSIVAAPLPQEAGPSPYLPILPMPAKLLPEAPAGEDPAEATSGGKMTSEDQP